MASSRCRNVSTSGPLLISKSVPGEAFLYLSTKRCAGFLKLVAVFFLATGAYAQLDRGSITGVVTDPSGAVISAAQVVITNTATDVTINLTTASDGAYAARSLNPGSYSVTAERAGFRKTVQSDVVEGVNQVVGVNL